MSFGSSHICLATRSLACVLLVVTIIGSASEAAATKTFTSASVVFGVRTESSLDFLGATFSDYGNIPSTFSSKKPVPRKMLTASFPTIYQSDSVRKSPTCTFRLTFPMKSIQSLEAERRWTSRAACRWTFQCSGKKAFAVKIGWARLPENFQLATVRASVFRRTWIKNRPVCR